MGNRFFPLLLGAWVLGLFLCGGLSAEEVSAAVRHSLHQQGQANVQGDPAAAWAEGQQVLAALRQAQPPASAKQDLRHEVSQLAKDQEQLNQQGQGNQEQIQKQTQEASQQAQSQGQTQAAQALQEAARHMQQAQAAQQAGQAQQAQAEARAAEQELNSALQQLPPDQAGKPAPGKPQAAQQLAQMQEAQEQARKQRQQAFGPPPALPRQSVERDW